MNHQPFFDSFSNSSIGKKTGAIASTNVIRSLDFVENVIEDFTNQRIDLQNLGYLRNTNFIVEFDEVLEKPQIEIIHEIENDWKSCISSKNSVKFIDDFISEIALKINREDIMTPLKLKEIIETSEFYKNVKFSILDDNNKYLENVCGNIISYYNEERVDVSNLKDTAFKVTYTSELPAATRVMFSSLRMLGSYLLSKLIGNIYLPSDINYSLIDYSRKISTICIQLNKVNDIPVYIENFIKQAVCQNIFLDNIATFKLYIPIRQNPTKYSNFSLSIPMYDSMLANRKIFNTTDAVFLLEDYRCLDNEIVQTYHENVIMSTPLNTMNIYIESDNNKPEPTGNEMLSMFISNNMNLNNIVINSRLLKQKYEELIDEHKSYFTSLDNFNKNKIDYDGTIWSNIDKNTIFLTTSPYDFKLKTPKKINKDFCKAMESIFKEHELIPFKRYINSTSFEGATENIKPIVKEKSSVYVRFNKKANVSWKETNELPLSEIVQRDYIQMIEKDFGYSNISQIITEKQAINESLFVNSIIDLKNECYTMEKIDLFSDKYKQLKDRLTENKVFFTDIPNSEVDDIEPNSKIKDAFLKAFNDTFDTLLNMENKDVDSEILNILNSNIQDSILFEKYNRKLFTELNKVNDYFSFMSKDRNEIDVSIPSLFLEEFRETLVNSVMIASEYEINKPETKLELARTYDNFKNGKIGVENFKPILKNILL